MAVHGVIRPNGLVVAVDEYPSPGVTVSVWVGIGSRHEPQGSGGLAHFLEHCLFKGTRQRTAAQVFRAIEDVGGDINACTGEEATGYYAQVPAREWQTALDVIADMVVQPTFPEHEVERERGVVEQEILAVEDSPEEFVQERFCEVLWRYDPLGRPIAGTQRSLASITRGDLVAFHSQWYRPPHMLVAVAGAVSLDAVLGMIECHPLDSLQDSGFRFNYTRPFPVQTSFHEPRDWSQFHLCIGFPTCGPADPAYPALLVLNTMLGGMSSARLQMEIREKRGLAYSITSNIEAFRDVGHLVVYAAVKPEDHAVVAELVDVELQGLVHGTFSWSELERAKACLRGHIALGLETSQARMQRLARNLLYFGHDVPLGEILASIDRVTANDILAVARRFIHNVTLVTAGPPVGRLASRGLELPAAQLAPETREQARRVR